MASRSAALCEPPAEEGPLFAGPNQPARRSFGLTEIRSGRMLRPVALREKRLSPFFALAEFFLPEAAECPDVLVVPPLSGHFPILLRDLVAGLVPYCRVHVADWINIRHLAPGPAPFSFATNISSVIEAAAGLPSRPAVIGVCQAGVPALAATALLAAAGGRHTPSALILIGAPIDPLANPTRVVRLLRERPLSWFETEAVAAVPEGFAGAGRRVYPAYMQLAALLGYLLRRLGGGGEMPAKLFGDDGADPVRFPFLDLYTSIMDLDAAFFVGNIRFVYHDCALSRGTLRWCGERVEPRAVQDTLLMTIEGEQDDIAAPGQTSAAHDLCTSLPARLHRRLILPGSGHFSLFHGARWRRNVLPAVLDAVTAASRL